MQEDNFFDNLNFESLRDCSGGPEVNQYQVYLDEAAIKGKRSFVTDNEDELTLFHKDEFPRFVLQVEDQSLDDENLGIINFNAKNFEFILVGDEYIEGINDPDELEDALNSWGVY